MLILAKACAIALSPLVSCPVVATRQERLLTRVTLIYLSRLVTPEVGLTCREGVTTRLGNFCGAESRIVYGCAFYDSINFLQQQATFWLYVVQQPFGLRRVEVDRHALPDHFSHLIPKRRSRQADPRKVHPPLAAAHGHEEVVTQLNIVLILGDLVSPHDIYGVTRE